jgi:hypothetical protein
LDQVCQGKPPIGWEAEPWIIVGPWRKIVVLLVAFGPIPRRSRELPSGWTAFLSPGGLEMDAFHRILSGQSLTRRELQIAGAFVLMWFAMDLVQWIDWLWGKFH